MPFAFDVAMMHYANCIESPGPAYRPAFGLLLQYGLIVTLFWTWLRKTVVQPIEMISHSGLAALFYGNVQHNAAMIVVCSTNEE